MKKGISLIVLVITIIVIIILAGAVILSLANNNPITQATEASFKSSLDAYNSELNMTLSKKYLDNSSFDPSVLNATTWDGVSSTTGTVKEFIPTMTKEDAAKYKISGGKLVYFGTTEVEQLWSVDAGVAGGQYDFNYTGASQLFTAPASGKYKIELWGAQGGGIFYPGKGGYTCGQIQLSKGAQVYIYAGQAGIANYTQTTFNGGGGSGLPATTYAGANSGGGATDIRLVVGSWDNGDSLKSRIMVAGGGGGSSLWGGNDINTKGGNAGGLTGEDGLLYSVYAGVTKVGSANGATQTTGYAFGIGAKAFDSVSASCAAEGKGGGGGGYYGGNAQQSTLTNSNAGGAGGSSFISGYTGCDAINAAGIHTGQANHYSGFIFTNSQMIPGNATMPKPNGESEIGHSGNGYARITLIAR